MSKTKNYQLTLWDYGDEDFTAGRVREDLTANFTKLDEALKAEETARVKGLAKKAEMVTGGYAGDDTEVRTITLGFTPQAVYLCREDGHAGYANGASNCYGGLALPGYPLQTNSNTPVVELTTTGFRIYHRGYYVSSNSAYYKYHYMAFR